MQHTTPIWQPMPSSCPPALSSLEWEWLRYPDSLTQKFATCFGEAASFVLQHEGVAPLLASEVERLADDLPTHWVRQSCWHYQQAQWLAARTVLPSPAQHPTLLTLASQPIGKLIFNNPNCRRVASDYAWLTPDSEEYRAIAGQRADTTPCWARRTLFCYGADRILISEVFFPAFFKAMAAQGVLCP